MSDSPKADAKGAAALPVIKLDRDKAFSSVHPPLGKVHFEQGGFYFDHLGRHVIEPHTETTDSGEKREIEFLDAAGKTKLKRYAALAVVRAKAKELERQALIDAGLNPDDPEAELPENTNVEKFDFVGWLTGRIKVQWHVVAKAMKDEYGYNPQNKEQAIAHLVVEHKLVDAEAVKI